MVHEAFSQLLFQDSCFFFPAISNCSFGGNRDDGDLVDIRRFYVQNGKVIPNSNVSIAGVQGNSITDKVGDQVCGSI